MVLDVPASHLLNKPLNPITSVLPMLINSYLTVHTGIAVVAVMLVTMVLLTLVITIVWHKPTLVALAFLMVFGTSQAVLGLCSLCYGALAGAEQHILGDQVVCLH